MQVWKEYWPDPEKNRLRSVNDVAAARERYYQEKKEKQEKFTNVEFLLKKRYTWMNEYLKPGDHVLEVGCGMGVAKDFLRPDIHLVVSDIEKHPWVDLQVDALNTRLPRKSFDAVICSNMIHHTAYPARFFEEMGRILKPQGRLIIQEGNLSLMSKIMLRLLRHEGWSSRRNVFSQDEPCNDPQDPWSGNNAIPNLLFDDPETFQKQFPYFAFQHQAFSEFAIFPLSGGVTAKARTIPLSFSWLKRIDSLDEFLVRTAPRVFALQRRVVLVKKVPKI